MVRMIWVCFGMILTVFLTVSMMMMAMEGGDEARTVGGDEKVGSLVDGGDEGVRRDGGGSGGSSGGDHHGDRATKEGEASDTIGDGASTEDTFHDLSKLSSKVRAPRLHQTSIFEAIGSSSQRGPTEGAFSRPMDEEEAADSNGEDDQYVESSEEKEEDEELEVLVHHLAKRRCVFQGVGMASWRTVLGNGPCEGYSRRRTSMLRFRTICAGQVCLGSLK